LAQVDTKKTKNNNNTNNNGGGGGIGSNKKCKKCGKEHFIKCIWYKVCKMYYQDGDDAY